MSGSDAARWAMVALALLAVVALIALARGVEHQRGQQVGATGAGAVVTTARLPG
jgi:hypothetical protein